MTDSDASPALPSDSNTTEPSDLFDEGANEKSSLDLDAAIARLAPLGKLLDRALKSDSPTPETLTTRRIGPFQIQRVLGAGGCGVVYLATDPLLNRQVAIKVPHISMLLFPEQRNRFVQEAKFVAQLQHPNIVEIFQVGTEAEYNFLVFEYCAGGSLSDWLNQQTQAVAPRLCAEIVLALAKAVDYAHQQGIIHRDVNPRNVLLVPRSETLNGVSDSSFPFVPKLSDFGLGTWLDERDTAVQSQTGTVMGTLPYMAPEQTRSDKASQLPAVDIYALGVILYQALTGVRPFFGPTPVETLRMIREEEPKPLRQLRKTIPRDLQTICLKCLDKRPQARYASARLLAEDLGLFLEGKPIRARSYSVGTHFLRCLARRRLPVMFTVLAFVVFIAGTLLSREFLSLLGSDPRNELQHTGPLQVRSIDGNQPASNERELQRVARQQSDLVRQLSYIDRIQVIAGLVETRPFDAVQMLREWIPTPGESDLRNFEWYYLMQACGGDILPFSTTINPAESLRCLQISDSGQQVFSASYLPTVERLTGWDVTSGKPVPTPFGFNADVRDFVINQQRDQLITTQVGEADIHVQEVTPNASRMTRTLRTPDGFVCYRVVKHPNQTNLVSICSKQREFQAPACVAWHNLETGQLIGRIDWADQRVFDMVVHPLDHFVTVAVEGSILLYNTERVQVQSLRLSNQTPLRTLALSTDGQQLAVSTDQQQIFLCRRDSHGKWSLISQTQERSDVLTPPDGRSCMPWNSVHFNTSGTEICCTLRTWLMLLKIEPNGQLNEQTRIAIPGIRDGKPLPQSSDIVWMTDRICGLWRPPHPISPLAGHQKEAWAVDYGRDGTLLATGSDDETVRLWDVASGTELSVLRGHTATVTKVQFSPDATLLATASLDGTVKIWDVQRRKLVRTLENGPTQIRAISWFDDGKRLATGDSPQDGKPRRILIWNVENGELLRSCEGFTDRINAVLVSKDQQHIWGAADDWTIRSFPIDTATDGTPAQLKNDSPVRCALLLDNTKQLITGDNQGIVRIWDQGKGQPVTRLDGHTDSVVSLALSPDGKVLASGGVDKTIYFWNVETGRPLMALKNQPGQVNGLAFSPAGDVLTAALHDGSIKHFHAPRFTPLQFH